jgi:hypothetical protein
MRDIPDRHVVRFQMVFHADLQLPGPKLLTSIVDSLKPRLMIDKLKHLRQAIHNLHVDSAHITR